MNQFPQPVPNPAPTSARMSFQWRYAQQAHPPKNGSPTILNIGSADDPLHFGDRAMHYDIDDWTAVHKWFTQGDAHILPFPDKTFDTVIMGDIHEHLYNPAKASSEAARVCARILVFTIFEEWRLPGHGQWVQEGQALADATVQEEGYKDNMHKQSIVYPQYKGYDDYEIPHLCHINQFNDEDIQGLVNLVLEQGFILLEASKAYEATFENHRWFNWLLAFERTSAGAETK